MNRLSLINRVKYSRTIYRLYNAIGSKLLSFYKQFIRPDDRLIVFVSFGGRRYDDSPKAIYEAMLADKRFDECRLVWAFIEPNLFDLPRGEKIRIDTLHYFTTILKARIWVTNSSMTRGLAFSGIRSFELNTWHGSAIKKMGSDVKTGSKAFGLKGEIEYNGVMLAQSQYDVEVFSRAFQRPQDSFRITGLPRNDILAHINLKLQEQAKSRLSIPVEKHVILYAPTYREYEKDSANNCVLTPPVNFEKWSINLGEDFVVLFRAHYEVAKVMGIKDSQYVKDVSSYPNLNDLMIASDILISDYSSIFFDYSIQGKPMLCFAYDYDLYEHERGVYFDIRKYLPSASDEDGLLRLLKETTCSWQDERTVSFRNDFVSEFGSGASKSLNIIAEALGSSDSHAGS